jgi:hypothetical protein
MVNYAKLYVSDDFRYDSGSDAVRMEKDLPKNCVRGCFFFNSAFLSKLGNVKTLIELNAFVKLHSVSK